MKAVVVSILIAVLAWTCIVPAQAKQPIDLIWGEVLLAEGLAFLGGWIGYRMGPELDRDCDGPSMYSVVYGDHCELATLVWLNGRTIGAIAGVWLTGSSAGVQGNIWGLVLLPGLGLMASLLADNGETIGLPEPIIRFLTIYYYPLMPALFATIGYNIGATMKANSSGAKPSSWALDMPLFSLDF